MEWQNKEGLTSSGEVLTNLYLQDKRGGDLEAVFPSLKSSTLERTARHLIERYDLKAEADDKYEELDEAVEQYVPPKILHFDLETTNFDPTYGTILMCGYGWQGEDEVHIVSIFDEDIAAKSAHLKPFDKDRYLVEKIAEILNDPEAEVLSGHFSKQGKFDIGFLNTRLLYHNLPPLHDKDHIDTQELFAKIRGKTRASSGLKNITGFINDEDERKGSVSKRTWYNAQHGDEEALKEIAEYCKQDVNSQRATLPKLMPFANRMDIPNGQILHDRLRVSCTNVTCKRPNEVERVGFKTTKAGMRYPRYVCRCCGHNMRGRKTVTDPKLTRLASM